VTKCLFCNEPLSLIIRLRDEQFCDVEHRQRYMQESRWSGVPLRPELQAPPLCGLVRYDPVCSAVDSAWREPVVRPMAFPKAQRLSPSTSNACVPRFGPETEQPLPLTMPAPRNAPRRRFMYRWETQGIVRKMLKEAVDRIRMRVGKGPGSVYDATGDLLPIEIPPIPLSGGPVLHWQAMAALDERALESIGVKGSGSIDRTSRGLPLLGALGNPLPMPCPMEKARAEAPLSTLEAARGLRGMFIPQVSIPLLRPRIAFGPRPGSGAQRMGERSGVIIPIREFQPVERTEAPPLARII
jgi:hypothetical protein